VARKWWTLLTVCLGMLMLLIDITIVNVAAEHRPRPEGRVCIIACNRQPYVRSI
jgi:hypothetical protein